MIVLGLNLSHNAAAALFVDGRLVFAVQEERLNRRKKWMGIPELAIRAALAYARLEPRDVDVVAVGERPPLGGTMRLARYLVRNRQYWDAAASFGIHRELVRRVNAALSGMGFDDYTLRTLGHHECHAASAAAFSPFASPSSSTFAVLTSDGMGNLVSATGGVWSAGRYERRFRDYYPRSLGFVYAAATYFAGLRPLFDEGKLMALAPLGRPSVVDELGRLEPLFDGFMRSFLRDGTQTPPEYLFAPPAIERMVRSARSTLTADEEGTVRRLERTSREDLAASAQAYVEREVRRMLARLPDGPLALAGGTFLNCVLNGRLRREREVWVQPAADDAGIALGACALVGGRRAEPMIHDFLGPSYDRESCAASIDEWLGGDPEVRLPKGGRAPASACVSVHEGAGPAMAGELVAGGSIVGWFSGRMEFGPRALGGRSILAHPGLPAVIDRLTARVKRRERYRPYAPSVLLGSEGEYFDMEGPSPFMILSFPARERARREAPGVVHVDGSARVQTVSRSTNEPFWRAIRAFEGVSGLPMLLNTSFNPPGDPIVHRPEEAIEMFARTPMDALYLEGTVLEKRGAERGSER